VILLLVGVIDDAQAWRGFSSPSILTIATLFVLAAALDRTGAVALLAAPLLGAPTSHSRALLRLCAPTVCLSAFLNNTPIVAMLIGVCIKWADANALNRRVLLMPLSYASILGGACTLVGTSTNLVLNAQVARIGPGSRPEIAAKGRPVLSQIRADDSPPCAPFGMFAMAPVAVPAAAAGIAFLALAAPRVLGGGAARAPIRALGSQSSSAYCHTELAPSCTPGSDASSAMSVASDSGLVDDAASGGRERWRGATAAVSAPQARRALAVACLAAPVLLSAGRVAPLLHVALAAAFVLVGAGALTLEQADLRAQAPGPATVHHHVPGADAGVGGDRLPRAAHHRLLLRAGRRARGHGRVGGARRSDRELGAEPRPDALPIRPLPLHLRTLVRRLKRGDGHTALPRAQEGARRRAAPDADDARPDDRRLVRILDAHRVPD